MNFHQLQYAVAIARHGLSVTQAASALGTSQPAISRALKALERELGFDLFVREGRAFSRITPQGARVLEYATRALAEIDSLKAVAADLNQDNRGTLSIATTHTQARYVLPPVVQAFRERYPGGRTAPAPGHLRADRGNGRHRSRAARDRHRVRRAVSRAGAAAGVSLAPPGDRAQAPSARRRAQADAAGAGEISAGHLRVQLFRAPPRCRPCFRAKGWSPRSR